MRSLWCIVLEEKHTRNCLQTDGRTTDRREKPTQIEICKHGYWNKWWPFHDNMSIFVKSIEQFYRKKLNMWKVKITPEEQLKAFVKMTLTFESQVVKFWYRQKGLATRNTHVKYEIPISYSAIGIFSSVIKGHAQGRMIKKIVPTEKLCHIEEHTSYNNFFRWTAIYFLYHLYIFYMQTTRTVFQIMQKYLQ